jgi:transposase
MSCPYNRLLDEFGYDDITLAFIVGMVGDIRRFSHYKKFVSYCGLDVSEKQSGKNQSKNCYITKRGNKLLRHTFYLSTLVYLSHRKNSPQAKFYERLRKKGKHPKQCITAMARKLAVKCYWDMMKCHV